MNQLAIDFAPHTHSRRTDPETSRDSAARVREFARGQCVEILAILRQHGPLGAEQIAAQMRLEAYSVRKRLADLEHEGLARPLPHLFRQTISGRRERIWGWGAA